jgi:hypothetical protein
MSIPVVTCVSLTHANEHFGFSGSEMHYSYTPLVFQRVEIAKLADGFLSHLFIAGVVGLA